MIRRQGPRLLLLALALVGASLCKRGLVAHVDDGGGFSRRAAANSVFGYVAFGAFKPLFIHHLWGKVDRLEREGRFWELIDVQERIARLQPRDVRIWSRQVYLIAFGVAQEEPDDVTRWRLYRRVLRRLDVGIDHNPESFELREMRFRIHFNLISTDRYCSRQLERTTGRNGLMTALAEAVSMETDFPHRIEALDQLRAATEESVEWLANRGRFAAAAELIAELDAQAARYGERFPESSAPPDRREVHAFWARTLRGVETAAERREGELPRIADAAAARGDPGRYRRPTRGAGRARPGPGYRDPRCRAPERYPSANHGVMSGRGGRQKPRPRLANPGGYQ